MGRCFKSTVKISSILIELQIQAGPRQINIGPSICCLTLSCRGNSCVYMAGTSLSTEESLWLAHPAPQPCIKVALSVVCMRAIGPAETFSGAPQMFLECGWSGTTWGFLPSKASDRALEICLAVQVVKCCFGNS